MGIGIQTREPTIDGNSIDIGFVLGFEKRRNDMNEIYFDSEPSEIENQILSLRTKLVNFENHLLIAKTPRDRKIAIGRIKVIQKQLKQILQNKTENEDLLD